MIRNTGIFGKVFSSGSINPLALVSNHTLPAISLWLMLKDGSSNIRKE
ncbi:MAG: hypothetical protein IPJ13_01950 [Saprospiraceae bacterium]|nr:hypothetical protein [Saprospiraceae bacterium]